MYSHQKKRPSTCDVIGIVLDPEIDRGRVCTSQPTAIDRDCLFVVDLKKLNQPRDVLCDDMGTWQCNGCRRVWVTVDEDGNVEFCQDMEECERGENCYRIIRKYYNHKGSPDFHRMTVFVEGMLPQCVKPVQDNLLAIYMLCQQLYYGFINFDINWSRYRAEYA